jgi:hypothetical protein
LCSIESFHSARVLAEREQGTVHLRQLVEDLGSAILNDTPVTMQAVVTGIAAKKNKDGFS